MRILGTLAAKAHTRTVLLSVLLSAALVLATTFLLVIVAWQGAYSFLHTTTAQRLEGGEQAFTYFTERRARDLETLARWVASDSSVVEYGGAGSAGITPALDSVLALGSADYIMVRAANGALQVAPPGLAALAEDRTNPQRRVTLPLPQGGEVIAGYLLGHAFSDQFKAWTGLDITIYGEDTLAGTSLRDTNGVEQAPSPVRATPAPFQFNAGSVPHLGRSFTLYSPGSAGVPPAPVGAYLISLPASFTALDHLVVLRDFIPFLAALLALAVASTVLVARQVTAPLRNLKGALSRIGEGDLDTPIRAESDAGVMPLASELEELRQRLHAALNQLAIEKSMYQGIFRSMGNGVFTTDATGRITSFNPAARTLLRSMEPGGPCWGSSTLQDPEGRSLCERACVWLWMSGEAEPTVVVTQLGPDGPDPRDLEITIAPIKDEAGRTVGLVHVLRDITLEQELLRLKERFLMSVAHELRTPLSSLSASVELLQDDFASLTPDARSRMLGSVRRGALRLGSLVSELLDLGSIQAGRFTVKTQPVLVTGPLQDAVASTEPLLEAKGQRVEVQLPEPSLTVLGDAPRLCQVMVNLISNAGKYGPEGDTIEVSIDRAGSAGILPASARIAVTDHGPGIGPEERVQVFEYYFRGADASRSHNGFGLGLAIIKGIVDAHGGEVGLESEPSRGTTFWFTVPLAEEPIPVILSPSAGSG